MGKIIKDLKLKKVGSQEASDNDTLYSRNGSYLTEKEVDKIKKKKSKRRFYTGFACVSIVVVLIATLVVGSFVAWDIYAKEPTGLKLPEALQMLADMYKDNSSVVTNPYDPVADLDSFYTDLKRGLYLSQECDITVNDIVSGLLSGILNKQEENNGESGENGEGSDQTLTNGGKLIMADEGAPQIGANGSITGNQALDELLESLNFDFSVLEGKDQQTLEKEMLELSDKELAAVLNEAFSTISEIDALKKIETEYGVKVADVVSVRQVIIDKATVLEQSDVRVCVTLRLNLREAAKTALSNNKDQLLTKLFGEGNQIPGIVSKLADIVPSVLPENVYVTASVFPNQQTWSAQVIVNNMTDLQQNAVNKLLDRFLATTDENGNNVSFMQTINQKVYDTIVKINDLIPINFTPSGTVGTKPIQAVINMLGAENLTQGDFLALIRDVKLPTAESLGVDGYTEEAQTLAANEFINGEFSVKYYFNNKVEGSQDEYFITAGNLFSKLNTFSEDEETLSRIEIRDKIEAGLDYADGGAFRPFADEKTLAALLNGYLKNQDYKVENMEPWIMDVRCTGTGTDDAKGDFFTLQITIELDLTGNIDAQLGDNESMKKLVKQLLPDSIYVFLTYTQYEGTDVNPSVALVDINKKGNEMSRQHFETLMSLLNAVQKKNPSGGDSGSEGENNPADQVSGMTFDELEEQLNEKIYQAFRDIEKNMGAKIDFVASSGSTEGGAILPNLFEILAGNSKLKYDPEQDAGMTEDEFNAKYAMTGEEMYLILSETYMYDPEGTDVESNVTEQTAQSGIDNFVKEIDAKYYIDTAVEGEDWSAKNIQNMLTAISGNYSERLRMSAVGSKSGLLDDTSAYEDLYPYLSQYEFANVVNESGKLDNLMQILPVSKIEYILIYLDDAGNPYIRMRINGDITFDNLVGEGAETVAQNKKYSTLFPYDVDVIVDIEVLLDSEGNVAGYEPHVNVNSIEDSQLDKMLFFVKRFSGQSSTGDGQELSKEGLELTIKSKLTSAFNDMTAEGNVDIAFVEKDATEGGVQLSTVFDLAVNKIYTEVGEAKPTGEEMRATIKGLHEGLPGYGYSNSDYDASGVGESNDENSAFFIEGGVSEGVASATVSAQFMDAYMIKKMSGDQFTDIVGGQAGDITFYQSYILPRYINGSAEEIQRNNSVRSYFGLNEVNTEAAAGPDNSDPDAQSYMLITLRVSTANLIGADQAGNKLVPSEIFITAQILLESGNSKAETRIFVNRLSDSQCEIMNRILKSAGYDKTLFGDEEVAVGEQTSTEKLIDNIFASELVRYDYTVTIPVINQTYSRTVVITVDDVVSSSTVWYCSLYSGASDDRRPYIRTEAAKSFNDADATRYGVAYLRFERSESLEIQNV